jgi:hypothetical protein
MEPKSNTLRCLRCGANYKSVHELRIPMSGLSRALQSRLSKPLSVLFWRAAVREAAVKMARVFLLHFEQGANRRLNSRGSEADYGPIFHLSVPDAKLNVDALSKRSLA